MHNLQAIWKEIKDSNNRALKYADRFKFVLIAFDKNRKIPDDYAMHSVTSEYFSDEELSETIISVREAGFMCEFFRTEFDFFKKYTLGGYENESKTPIIIPVSGFGTGRARAALLPAYCQRMGIATCGSDCYSWVLSENKFHTFCLLEKAGLPVPKSWLWTERNSWMNDISPAEGIKVIAKPIYECASIGITKNSVFEYSKESSESFLIQMNRAFRQPFLVQEFIPGSEVEVPVIEINGIQRAIGAVELVNNGRKLGDDFFDYDMIYDDIYGFSNFFGKDKSSSDKIMDIAEEAIEIISLSGISRVDFRINDENIPYITDVNTPPHYAPHSSMSHSAKFIGHKHVDLIQAICTIGITRSLKIAT